MPPPTSTPGAPTQGRVARRTAVDQGDPVAVLRDKGVTGANKSNLRTLVNVLKSFKDFKAGYHGQAICSQILAVVKLLDEAVPAEANEDSSRPATQRDINMAVDSIKAAMTSLPMSQATPLSFADVVRTPAGLRAAAPRPPPSAETQEKEIFVSLKNADASSPFVAAPATELTGKCNALLTEFFRDPKNGGLNIDSPLRSTSKLPNNNMVLSFKQKEDAVRARVHAEDWVKLIDPGATVPQRTYAIVAHNAPAAVWSNPVMLREAMTEIEKANSDVAPLDFAITNMVWLNSPAVREKTGRGPLMISLKTKAAANAAIDLNLAIRGVTCSVSIYVPRPQQCFRCQDWGHRATECAGEERCGHCAGPHASNQHMCLHDNPCDDTSSCNKEPAVCANCKGAHRSWVRSCPAAKAALAAQSKRDEYRAGRYEQHTPFTFADSRITRRDGRRQAPRQPRTITPRAVAPTSAPPPGGESPLPDPLDMLLDPSLFPPASTHPHINDRTQN